MGVSVECPISGITRNQKALLVRKKGPPLGVGPQDEVADGVFEGWVLGQMEGAVAGTLIMCPA